MSEDNLLEIIQAQSDQTLMAHLGIEFTAVEKQKIVATMPVDHRTKQRFGILHGGASVALAETVASVAGWLNINTEKEAIVGLEINANHLKTVKSGLVTATATPIRIGKKIHVWTIEIKNEAGELNCISRCTLAVIDKIR